MYKHLLFLALLFASACNPKLPPAAGIFENEIRSFEQKTKAEKPAHGQILLYGSSSFRMWGTYAADLSGYAVVNRGFGGSQMSDAVQYFDRVVMPLKPSLVLLYEGDNDLASGESVDQVMQDFEQLTKLIKRKLPKTHLAVISARPSVARTALRPKQDALNSRVQVWCAAHPDRADFIDVRPALLDVNGQANMQYLVDDKLHLNAAGYAAWTRVIREYLAGRSGK
jgi:lysophospholipase L1-like esterase